MIIGGSKKEVIKNIKRNLENNELNKKVEVSDPSLSDEEIKQLLSKFYKNKHKLTYYFKRKIANHTVKKIGKTIYQDITVKNEDVLKNYSFSKGAIITSNHFNPLDSYCVRYIVEKILHKKLYIVVQDTNLAMDGNLGFLFNNMDVIPLSKSPNYIIKRFIPELKSVLDQGNFVLIYPEEEMWFNYRLPRPCKRGAYQFAHELDVPVISCFVKMIDTDIPDNDEFNKVLYEVYINKVIYPEIEEKSKSDALKMADVDYQAKVKTYEKVYQKKLNYTFDINDIAGWNNKIS